MSKLLPLPHVTPEQLQAGQRALVMDLAWASICGALSGGVILVAFALALGATPVQIGVLAAIPFITQALQLPATVMVDKLRQRKRIGVLTITAARVVILMTAVLPFLGNASVALTALILSQVLIAGLGAVGGCAVNSWLHQLIPGHELGHFFARRLFSGTTMACVGTLAAGALIDHSPFENKLHVYAVSFAASAVAGFLSSWFIVKAPEPQMRNAGPEVPMRERLMEPFADPNFRRLLTFLGSWIVASNLAAPFITVYLIEQRGYDVGTVTSMWVTSQLANALTLYLWGRLSHKLTNKAVLAVVLPVHFLCMLALVFADAVESRNGQLALLYVIHLVLGVATGGIGLATGNLGLKLAPQGKGTAYLAAIGLVSAAAGGVAPILAGWLAQSFQLSELTFVVRWISPNRAKEMSIFTFAHWELLFAMSAMMGLYVMHALSRVREGEEVSERVVVQEFALEAWRSVNNLSSIAGALGNLFPFERLTERRKWWQERHRQGPNPAPANREAAQPSAR